MSAALLAGPTALAFFAGGYFDGPRAWAGVGAWALVAIIAIAIPRAVPRGNGGRLALAALALLAAWTLLSMIWAPIAGTAYHDGQRVVLYAGVLLAAAVLLRAPSAQRAVEPALAAGTLIVIGYGLSGRLLPGLLHFARSVSAAGPPRAAAHLLERDGRGGGDRLRAGRPAGRRPLASVCPAGRSPRRRRPFSAWACTSASPGGRCSPASPGWSR